MYIVTGNVQISQRIMNICNSLAITCLQHSLSNLALSYLQKAYKTDLNLFELESDLNCRLEAWKGRILMLNILTYHFAFVQRDLD